MIALLPAREHLQCLPVRNLYAKYPLWMQYYKSFSDRKRRSVKLTFDMKMSHVQTVMILSMFDFRK